MTTKVKSTGLISGGGERNRLCVGVFGYSRPQHLRRCLQSLAACHEAADVDLHIYCDGPPLDSDGKLLERIAETREVAAAASGFGCVKCQFADRNRGVALAVPSGVSEMLQVYDQVVVVEDDLEFSPFFLRYMRDGLTAYASSDEVMAISGYTWPTFEDGTTDTYFSRFTHYWGWGTWRRAWQAFCADGESLRDAIVEQGLAAEFDKYSVFHRTSSEILDLYINNVMGIWDICWSASVLLKRGFCLYPRKSMVRNHGFDGSGMHCRPAPRMRFDMQDLSSEPVRVSVRPATEEPTSFINHQMMRRRLRGS